MNNPVWTNAIKSCSDPRRAKHFFDLLAGASPGSALQAASAEQARVLAALFSGSQALSNLLVAKPDWLGVLEPETLQFPRRKQGLGNEVGRWLKPLLATSSFEAALTRLREFKQREMLRIAARDLARLSKLSEIMQELSDVADVCLEVVWQVCHRQLAGRYGVPCHRDANGRWQPTAGCVLGMGKLGGQELNYSSDVDVLFAYSEEGSVFRQPPTGSESLRSVLTNHLFFNRLAEAFIAEVSRRTPEGWLYRIDLRLRPEGDAGPLTRSLAGFENYYAQWGQTWERMMLIKARGVAGDGTLAAEFLEMVQPFRYPRSINEDALREVVAMKGRIERDVLKADELDRNVKLGRGGIREVEFVAQALQTLHAGRQPFLQGAQTLPCLGKLAQYGLLSEDESRRLASAYGFLREVEHRLQMEENLQTHTIPTDHRTQKRLAGLMGIATRKDFEAARQTHTENVRRIFDRLLKETAGESESPSLFPGQFEGAEEEWKKLLTDHTFKDPDKAFRVLREFVEGPGYVHVSPRTSDLAHQLLPRLFALCPQPAGRNVSRRRPRGRFGETSLPAATVPLSDPDRVVTRLDSFISAYGARGTLFELWHSNPSIFELLVLLFDRSEFLAELAIRTPDLVDELVMSGRLRRGKSADETLRDLRHGLGDHDQHLWLRRYHQAELMRIGLRDILGLADPEQYLTELSGLAEACLQYALEVVMRKHNVKLPPFVIVGLGKLGGVEIDYGSDLDVVFIADSTARDLGKLTRLALEALDLLSARTEQGVVFRTDARLRPDGEKGLLVNTLSAYEQYYRQRAQLWEIQSLTRMRAVAGDPELGARFQTLAASLVNFRQPSLPLAAYAPDWKHRIHQMRMRIEKERTPPGKDDLAIKTGKGGLMDAEFIAQTLCLENGWQEANTVHALERGRAASVMPDADKLIQNYRQVRRVEGILRRWSYEGETVLPDDPAPYYRVSVRCGFTTPDAFHEALAGWRRAMREVYLKVFQQV
ncbi:MAG TPA: bifunctional [glutamate--ammonia ligase]-adenylyl-L-tyrosine phosphorylase/[glutamate--ammonia-ligase] adenylyltransferase [Candidatus Paceibacterota bacterium]|nr:bifunctional [glutamate--ammonia ligase]-adenylyl-L-tyrosine phosphorylase/[glutamate--ammonia-ligase] adenylyltransferase [Verrucomicrobiota bacterium]HSA10846.1 bifunctional [glutamate--ammonia ligase]-adenylyl-L-tyrosine phosphorylase/[glutamate--ammonia-ligase] adenylyltransferase [Candidatus Paceibacterota bacterium]